MRLPVFLRLQLLACAAAVIATSHFANADIIKLKNGETIEGVVVSKDDRYITIQLPNGELGMDAAFVDSVDATKGPRTNDDLAAIRDKSKERLELANLEREQANARTRAQANVAEASARRDGAPDATTEVDTTVAAEDSVASRLAAIDQMLSTVERKRDREKLKRFLYNYFFGGRAYDPVLGILQ
ncbi:MAG: hypothetical protein ACKVS6_13025 [Planctomycetota bacterium]